MRLWHYKLIPVLPRQQLLGQWRECCLIAKELSENGTPNHILVNPVTKYPINEFLAYWITVENEMLTRGYKVDESKYLLLYDKGGSMTDAFNQYIFPQKPFN